MLRNQIVKSLDAIRAALEVLDRRAEKMELVLMVREPGSTAAADAYDGLRKQVVAAATDRLSHLTQLVQLHSAIRNGADRDVLSKMADGWCESAGLSVVADPGHLDVELLYDIVGEGGSELEVVDPAYVDTISGRVIRRGRAHRLERGQPALSESPLDQGGEGHDPDGHDPEVDRPVTMADTVPEVVSLPSSTGGAE